MSALAHVKPGPGFDLNNLDQLDEIRRNFNAALEPMEVTTVADIVFVEVQVGRVAVDLGFSLL